MNHIAVEEGIDVYSAWWDWRTLGLVAMGTWRSLLVDRSGVCPVSLLSHEYHEVEERRSCSATMSCPG